MDDLEDAMTKAFIFCFFAGIALGIILFATFLAFVGLPVFVLFFLCAKAHQAYVYINPGPIGDEA